jgi:hypothetical protein
MEENFVIVADRGQKDQNPQSKDSLSPKYMYGIRIIIAP